MAKDKTEIERIDVGAYTVPGDAPGGDGTKRWDSVTLVAVHAYAGGQVGFGYTYADASAARFIREHLETVAVGLSAMSVREAWVRMSDAVRDLGGNSGLSQMAISAVDTALWDLKARLLDVSLVDLFGSVRPRASVYGSGGYVTYSKEQLQAQLGGWVAQGIARVKMKVAWHPEEDLQRVRWAREAIGPDAQLMIDANGAYAAKQALGFAEQVKPLGVVWFEEPVPSDDEAELSLLRGMMPAPIEVAAGEYGYRLDYFRRMLEAQAVDVLQADASRCGGYTAFLGVDALCQARRMPLSSHCAPALHAPVACASVMLRHMEYFHDHVRIENKLMDGVLQPDSSGCLAPDRSRPGNGLAFKAADAERYRVAY